MFVLDNAFNQESTANQLLQIFDMTIDYRQAAKSAIYDTTQEIVATTQRGGKIQGGKPLLLTKDKSSILSMSQIGDGAVVAMADSTLFANSSLGSTKNVPNEQQSKLYDLEFWILRQLMQMPGEVWHYESSKAGKQFLIVDSFSLSRFSYSASWRRTN